MNGHVIAGVPTWVVRRSRAIALVTAALLIVPIFVMRSAPAGANAANPINGSVQADITSNLNGTITLTISGRWEWFSQNASNCADSRNVGYAIAWGDGDGYPITKNGVTLLVGTTLANTLNPADNVVHPTPDENGDMQDILDPVARCFTPAIAKQIAEIRADLDTQARIEELGVKCNEGELTEAERREYGAYVEAIDLVGILQAKARAVVARPFHG